MDTFEREGNVQIKMGFVYLTIFFFLVGFFYKGMQLFAFIIS